MRAHTHEVHAHVDVPQVRSSNAARDNGFCSTSGPHSIVMYVLSMMKTMDRYVTGAKLHSERSLFPRERPLGGLVHFASLNLALYPLRQRKDCVADSMEGSTEAQSLTRTEPLTLQILAVAAVPFHRRILTTTVRTLMLQQCGRVRWTAPSMRMTGVLERLEETRVSSRRKPVRNDGLRVAGQLFGH